LGAALLKRLLNCCLLDSRVIGMRSSTVVCRGRMPWMGSLVGREPAARAEADRLRIRVEELTEQLAMRKSRFRVW
jgi:hypothetical protein